ncbi:MAG: hypothetical protein NZ729_01570 [Methylococcales bacterium]|nr:hypothetical protein [Methylococcales bacterium]MEE2766217.1 hypothetical protein [Pseudomonadota bacterium]
MFSNQRIVGVVSESTALRLQQADVAPVVRRALSGQRKNWLMVKVNQGN